MGQRQLKSIVRKEAMDNYSSSELLDQQLIVVAARSWILLCVIGAVLLAATIWGFAGSIPIQIDGLGIIIEKNTPLRIANPTATGSVIERKVKPGDIVEAGDTLLIFGNPATQTNLQQAKSELALLIEQDKIADAQEQVSYSKLEKSISLQTSAAQETIKRTRELLALYKKQVQNYEKLSKDQLIPTSQLTAAQATLYSAQESQSTLLASLAGYQSQLQSENEENVASKSQRATQIQIARTALAKAETNRLLNTSFKAPVRSRIVSVLVNIGDFVSPGSDVLIIVPLLPKSDPSTSAQQVIAFVGYAKGKEIKPGMIVQVAIPFATSTEYGFIKGKVNRISNFASDEISVKHKVGSNALAKYITETIKGVPLELTVDLESDPNTPSGFSWTSDKGFPGKIPQLSECTLKITTHSERPIDLVLPWFKKIIGIDAPPVLNSTS